MQITQETGVSFQSVGTGPGLKRNTAEFGRLHMTANSRSSPETLGPIGRSKSLQLVHIITGLGRGGAESVLLQLCAASQGKGWSHTVVSLTDRGEMASVLEEAGVRVIDLGMTTALSIGPALWRLRKILRVLEPDIVQTWMYHADLIGGIAARLAGVRSLLWGIRSTVTDSLSIKRSTRFLIRVCAVLSRVVPARIVVCAYNAAEAHAKAGYRRDKMIVIQNGIDCGRFNDDGSSTAEWKTANGIDPELPLLGIVARFTPQKDHLSFLRAIERLVAKGEAFQCILVGNAMDATNAPLMRWIRELGLSDHVVLIGPRSDLPDVMRALDLHVLSSRVEGFPNVLAEAMACGTPCVSTDAGDAEYILADNGWLVSKGDFNALANAMGEALTERRESPEVWQDRRDASKKHIREEFGLQRMVDDYAELWRTTADIR
jgi:glycosyltransferase involved in cell wall biosynthesis